MNSTFATMLRAGIPALLLFSTITAGAAPPDLINGGVPGDSITINLGPTGMRGWVYHVKDNTGESRQIQVKSVAAGSPAAGKLAANDVILGASGTGADPVNFTSDARKSFANAINDAEARNPATLKLIRWRSGTTSTVEITLQTMGAYSATAPYNCPKSALILQQGLQAIMSGETAGRYSFGLLTLLAANNPSDSANAARLSRAQTEARARIPNATTRAQMMSDARDATSMVTWERGHTLVALAEYYLVTGDTQILPAVEAYAVNIAKNTSLFGTVGHIFAEKFSDGSPNGPMGGVYGPVNSTGMTCFLGLLLARECGFDHPGFQPDTGTLVEAAIVRSSRFFSYYADKGSVPYGEHEPYPAHESNGKSGLAALCFALQDNRVAEGKFYAKMATAAPSERELGHTGAFFNYLWSPLGAAVGGEEAAALHFSRIRWMLDLNRRWDRKFDYDCLNGEGPNSGSTYNTFRMSTAALLVYALPLRQLHLTGRSHAPDYWLSAADLADAADADTYSVTGRSIADLISDTASWSPKIRRNAAIQLGANKASVTTTQRDQLHATANNTALPAHVRAGACDALGRIANSASASVLANLLSDPQKYVRYAAAEALRYMPNADRQAQLTKILTATAANARPVLPYDEEDPLHFDHGRLAMLLFYSGTVYGPKGILYNNITGVDRNLLYPAIRAVAATPIGMSRSTLGSIYPLLTKADTQAVADAVVETVKDFAPSDRMFASGVRQSGFELMWKYDIAEGVPTGMRYIVQTVPGNRTAALLTLEKFAASYTTITPEPDVIALATSFLNATGGNAEQNASVSAAAQAVLAAIAADTNPKTLVPFKGITSVTADHPQLTLPANSTVLRVDAFDHARGDSRYTWRKVNGPGNVTFNDNGTAAARDCAIVIANQPGHYLFEVKMSDSRGLTEVYQTVAVTLRDTDGSVPNNSPPVAYPQTISVNSGSVKPVTLTGTDPEGHPLVFSVISQPAHGALSGTAPTLSYTSDPDYHGPDSFTFQVMDSEGAISSATISINVKVVVSELFAHEGFDYAPVNDQAGGRLAGKDGGTGWGGPWQDSTLSSNGGESFVYDSQGNPANLYGGTYGEGLPNWDGVVNNLPTTGGYAGLSDWSNQNGGNDRLNSHRPLAQSAGAMAADNNGVLWLSAVWHLQDNAFFAPVGIALVNNGSYFTERARNLVNSGFGVGVGLGNDFNNEALTKDMNPLFFSGGSQSAKTTGTNVSYSDDNIIILKFEFGPDEDTVSAWYFTEDQEMTEAAFNANAKSCTSSIDENNLTTLAFSTIRFGNAVDEFRIGNSFESVIGVGIAPPDTDPPALVDITDDRAGETMQQGEPVTYTLTFSEPMDTATIGASDFGNAGTSSININSVTHPVPGVVHVSVTPVTTGTLQFRVLQGASLTDVAGNPLDTSAPLTDDTVIPVDQALIEVPSVVGMTRPEAEAAIIWANFTVGSVTFQNNGSVAEGDVISQTPSDGTILAFGSTVDLVVSLGPIQTRSYANQNNAVSGLVSGTVSTTHVSDNIRQSIQEIETTGNPGNQRYSYLEHRWRFEVAGGDVVTFHIEAHHTANTENDDFTFSYSTAGAIGPWTDMLTVTKTADDNSTQSFEMPSGTSGTIHVRVIDTDRTAGRRTLDTVFIDHMYFQFENTAAVTTVPGVIGLGQSTAEAEISAADLLVGVVTMQHHSTVPAGLVISQDPDGGTSVAEGSSVGLVVSLGPVMVSVPNVTGFTQVTAVSTITAANLTVGTVTTENHASVPAGNVISQTPTGGTNVAEGSTVNIVVSLGPDYAGDYGVWSTAHEPVEIGGPTDDYDTDGMTNDEERIWGLDPTSANSANPIKTHLDAASGTFTYTRRDPALTGYGHSVWFTDDFLEWKPDLTAQQSAGAADANGVQIVAVTLSPEILGGERLFVRVKAVGPQANP